MKNLFKFSVLVFSSMCMLIACEKSNEIVVEEGVKSTMGDQVLPKITEQTTAMPVLVLHRHYDKSLSADEAQLQWDAETAAITESNTLKAHSTEWYFSISTKTGTQTYNETDGPVALTIGYNSNIGKYATPYFKLDDYSKDDFEGGWDYFMYRSSIPGESVTKLSIYYAGLYHQGTDGWFVTNLNVKLESNQQSISATNGSSLAAPVNVWLDNTTSTGWDVFWTPYNYNTGWLYF